MRFHPKKITIQNQLASIGSSIDGLTTNMLAQKRLAKMYPNDPSHTQKRLSYAERLTILRRQRTKLKKQNRTIP